MLVSSYIGRLARWAARSGNALLLCLSVVALSACKLDAKPPAGGGLVVAIDTDMSMPKDLDEVRLEVTQGATVLFNHSQQLSEGATALPLEIQVPDSAESAPVLVRALGVKDGELRVERSAITSVPTMYLGYLRLALNYLCDGMVAPSGESSCGETMTCVQGTCVPATIAASLPDYYQRDGARTNASTACFDVAQCFSMATEMIPEPIDGCSFASSRLFPTDINVALRMEPGSAGICTQTACWIVLDSGGDGFRVGDDGERVLLPEGICAQRAQGANLRVAMSMQCPSKGQSMPLCRGGSSDAPSGDPQGPATVDMNISPVSDACTGGGQRACEMCGTKMRVCQSGLWSPLSACMDQGVCEPETVESCGVNGIRTCGGDCTWGDCENQTCEGPATRSCGNCGTQRRSCNNGVWSEWSLCSDEGACAPGASQACGSGGTQACMGSCEWGECTTQVCAGPATEPCGNCGTRSRTCDANTGVWSDWGECEDEGECRPDATRPCGRDGEQTCGGNCRWDVLCTGQTCEGPARRACGFCGTQTRTCDMMTGEYSDWSPCLGQGECMPDSIMSCGNGGERVCGGMCRWGTTCTGQTCEGPSTEPCGNCGVRTRTCDTNTGSWSAWSACRNEGDCTPGATRECGSGGTQTCSNSCRWSEGCPGQMCDGLAERTCANNQCVVQERTCNADTGRWNAWTPATCPAGCVPGQRIPEGCPANSERVCAADCTSVNSPCTCADGYMDCTPSNGTVDCINVQEDALNCGECGRQCTGNHICRGGECVCREGWMECAPGGECVSLNSDTRCGSCTTVCMGGTHCENGMCRCQPGQTACDDECVNTQNNVLHCGQCDRLCEGGRMCVNGECQCPEGRVECNGTCVDVSSDRSHCGRCDNACGSGQVCEGRECRVDCTPPLIRCGGRCVDPRTDGAHCGDCDIACMNNMICQNSSCACAPGYGQCAPNGPCVPLNTISNCGECGETCTSGMMCEGGDCVCDGSRTECNGTCVNTQSDPMNCGGCGERCASGRSCIGGECECANDEIRCNGQCVPRNTNEHCDGCSPCPNGMMCMGGMCQTTCPGTMCGAQCVDTQTDERHCGGCNDPCPTGATCVSGDCVCPNGTVPCDGACVSLDSNEHCGSCAISCNPPATTCMNRACQPACNGTMCGAQCVDTQTDERHCGDCDDPCPSGTTCVNGDCVCPNGTVPCDGACVSLDSNEHCGSCAISCDPPATTCVNRMCRATCDGTICGGECVDTRNNNQHCGDCDNPCNGDLTCRNGRCGCTIGIECGNSCCMGDQVCMRGRCQTPPEPEEPPPQQPQQPQGPPPQQPEGGSGGGDEGPP